MDKIKKHYKELAVEYSTSKQMSMEDINTRDMEVAEIIKYLMFLKTQYPKPKILEIGCGNGYTAEKINEELNFGLTCIDFCEDLIDVARTRELEDVKFEVGDVLNLSYQDNAFHIVFTERCLINLDSWKKQRKALDEIWRILKKSGVFVMMESFTDGLENLNEARRVVGLESIQQPFHNRYMEKKELLDHIKNKFVDYSVNHPDFMREYKMNFLSSYYFGSRVIYPALIKDRELEYNNKFIEFFKYMEPYGNYSYIQPFILEKI